MIEGYDGGALVAWALASIGGAIVILLWGFVRSVDGRVERWAASRAVPLTAETRPYVTRRLRSSRRWRTAAVVVAWLLPFAWTAAHRSAYATLDVRVVASTLLLGYLAAVLVAEIVAARRLPRGRGAVLDTRRVDQYVPRVLFAWSGRCAATSVAVATAAILVVDPEPGRPFRAATQAALAVASVGALVAARAASTFIVSRRQPVVSRELLRADDALRSWSAHSCIGALLTAQLLALSQQLNDVIVVVDGPVRWVLGAVATVALCAAAGTIQVVGSPEWRWRVRRDVAVDAEPAT